MDMVRRFDIWLVELDPTVGSEVNKTRPCMVISPDEVNHHLKTAIVLPLTSTIKDYPTRVNCIFQNKRGQLVIDQIRSVDKKRLIKKLGTMNQETSIEICEVITETFRF